MVSVAEWKDFPKGLRVLVLDEDSEAAAETKSRLEGFEYVVSTFSNETEALAVLANEPNSFHVALVEVSTGNSCGGFRFLQTACNIPTVMMSKRSCLSTTMKCIALGASEFLQKPISEDKLKNIWQHVVHKAFSESGTVLSESLKPVKATIVSMLQLGHEHDNVKSKSSQNGDSSVGKKAEAGALHKVQSWMPTRTDSVKQESSIEPCNSEKFPAPSTPQLEQGGRSSCEEDKTLKLDDATNLMIGPAHPDTNCGDETIREVRLDAEATSAWSSQVDSPASVKKESPNMYRISLKARNSTQSGVKPADVTRDPLGNGIFFRGTSIHSRLETVDVHVVSASGITEEEVGSAEGSKSDENIEKEAILSSYACNEENVDSSTENIKEKKNSAEHGCKKSNISSSKKKFKVEWTMDLHRRFVQAVEQLGVDQAIPSRILDLMKVDGLTRHNVASHLQKYRSHRRHILPRDDELASRRYWQQFDPAWTRTKQDESWSRKGNPASGPILAYSPVQLHSTPHGTPVGPPLHVWGHPTIDQSGSHMWQQLQVGTPTTWQAQDGSFWKYPGVYADAWGCPTVGMPFYPQPMMKLPSNHHGHRSTPNPNSTIQGVSVQHPAILDPLNGPLLWEKTINGHPPKEVIDEAFKEALNNPWTPLPLGLKPPSMESVIAELQRQGINKIPPPAS